MLKRTQDASRPGARTHVVRFAGDSGDGIQLVGNEFARSTGEAHEDFLTFPDA